MDGGLSRGRFLSSALSSVALFAAPVPDSGRPHRKRGRGALLRTEEFAAGPQAIDPAHLTDTPLGKRPGTPVPAAFTLADLPPVVDQGTIDSCCAHAFGFGLGAHTIGVARGTPPDDPALQPSRAWMFAKSMLTDDPQNTCSIGTYPLGYLEQLVATGAPSERDVPYEENCAYISGVQSRLASFTPNPALRIGSYRTLLIQPRTMAKHLPQLKAHIAHGQIVAFVGAYGNDYAEPALRDGVYFGDAGFGTLQHAQLLVGYDDARGRGAFLVQNSYGTEWPAAAPGGRIWWDYTTFFASQSCLAIALPARHGPPRGMKLDASLANAPGARISAVRRAALGGGEHGLVLVHEFDEPVQLTQVRVNAPGGPVRAATTTMTVSNGYSLIASPEPWRAAVPNALEIDAKTTAGAVTYRGIVTV